ncbi:MAG: DUF4912 domain-containing protein [Candidatus Sumerlaeia bacterium]
MAAKKKIEQEEARQQVVKKKVTKAKAGVATARKEKAAKPATPKTTRTVKAAKAEKPEKAAKPPKPAEESKAGKLVGGLIKRVAKVLPRKKVVGGKAVTTRSGKTASATRAAAAVKQSATPAAEASPAAAVAAADPRVSTKSKPAVAREAEGESRLVLMMRDPQTLHAFWSISTADREKYGLDKAGGAPPLLLRLYDREGGNGSSEVYRCQIVVASTERWTVQVPPSGRTWRAEIGFIGRDGRFKAITSSNMVVLQGPPLVMSIQEGVATVPFGEGGEAIRQWAQSFELPVMSPLPIMQTGQPGSLMQPVSALVEQLQPGSLMAQPGSLMGQPGSQMGAEKQKGFWLQVQTELILYGATVPGSKLTVQNEPVELKEDGSFSLRFALPEGFFVFPVHATSPDGDDEREITPVVLRLTQ